MPPPLPTRSADEHDARALAEIEASLFHNINVTERQKVHESQTKDKHTLYNVLLENQSGIVGFISLQPRYVDTSSEKSCLWPGLDGNEVLTKLAAGQMPTNQLLDLAIREHHSLKGADFLFVPSLCVVKDEQKKGYGTNLLTKAKVVADQTQTMIILLAEGTVLEAAQEFRKAAMKDQEDAGAEKDKEVQAYNLNDAKERLEVAEKALKKEEYSSSSSSVRVPAEFYLKRGFETHGHILWPRAESSRELSGVPHIYHIMEYNPPKALASLRKD
ncbi:Uu.00g006780.m01.CDS01 [Anthostomella pinea]|uniref:Uu.00g006780.m01.CDS01 n=1 Tax=Anthostomella pinea TaxID=933095 RepID=A0AAI8VF19_9PEZI|nr:Uu.00g006780.m01.CDS01 [Anthostomella pinea]